MNYLSVCSGIEAATVAWHHMGWKPVGFSEIEKFPSQVLEHHYPNVTNFGDMTKYKDWNLNDTVELLVGGTPCQSFSVAGLRKGLADPRGNLALVYLGIADHFKPKWIVWENVPGVLSSNGGRDFGSFLGALAELGYGFAYRVLDAQYFGVAQRRRRVFVVGCLGDWRSAAAVLFDSESLRWNPAPSREKGEEAAKCLTTGIGSRYDAETDTMIPSYCIQGSMIGRNDNAGPQGDGINEEVCFTQNTTDRHGVAQPVFVDTYNGTVTGEISVTLTADCAGPTHSGPKVMQPPSMQVRRLTPTECERLQGFPDGYTDIQPNGKQTPDGPRYKALGNSMAVPVMRWIGERIQMVEDL